MRLRNMLPVALTVLTLSATAAAEVKLESPNPATAKLWVKLHREHISAVSAGLAPSGGFLKATLKATFRCDAGFHMDTGSIQIEGIDSVWARPPSPSRSLRNHTFNRVKLASKEQLIAACQQGKKPYNVVIKLSTDCWPNSQWDQLWRGGHKVKRKTVTLPIDLRCEQVVSPGETYARVSTQQWKFTCPDGFVVVDTSQREVVSARPTPRYCVRPWQTQPRAGGNRACPFYYVFDGGRGAWVKSGELIKDLVGKRMEALQQERLAPGAVGPDHRVRISIREEKDEVSYLDHVALRVGSRIVLPRARSPRIERLRKRDGRYLILRRGETVELEFDLSGVTHPGPMHILSAGYYEPLY